LSSGILVGPPCMCSSRKDVTKQYTLRPTLQQRASLVMFQQLSSMCSRAPHLNIPVQLVAQ